MTTNALNKNTVIARLADALKIQDMWRSNAQVLLRGLRERLPADIDVDAAMYRAEQQVAPLVEQCAQRIANAHADVLSLEDLVAVTDFYASDIGCRWIAAGKQLDNVFDELGDLIASAVQEAFGDQLNMVEQTNESKVLN